MKTETKANEDRRIENAILGAIEYFGGVKSDLARALGVSDGLIQHWINFRMPVSLKKAVQIQKVTRGKVKTKDLVRWMPGKL